MPDRLILLTVVLSASMANTRIRAAEVDVLSWALSSSVSVGAGTDSRHETTVENPLNQSYFANLQNSTAYSSITASWDASGFFDFMVEGEHANQGNNSLSRAISGGFIFLTPMIDSFVSISGTYNYMLASGHRQAILGVSVSQEGVSPPLLRDFQVRSSLIHPPVGQMTHQTDGLLLAAGVNYVLGYEMSLTSTTGSPTDLSHGDGFVHMLIHPVPSPATGAIFLSMMPIVLRRSRRRRGI